MRAHNWAPLIRAKKSSSTLPWPVCKGCGLLALKNAATEKAMRAPCPDPDDEAPRAPKR